MSIGQVSPMGAFHYQYGNHLRISNHSPPETVTSGQVNLESSCNPEQKPDAVNASSGLEKNGDKEESQTCCQREEEKEEPGNSLTEDLSTEEEKQVQELKQRDREVKAHEQAHVAAGGHYVNGGAHYEYEAGPDGRNYAVGGEVSIDASPVSGDPLATIQKAQTVKRAALAPANPSAQDRRVAAKAARMEAEARGDLAEQKTEEAGRASQQKAEGLDDVSGDAAADEPGTNQKAADQTSISPPDSPQTSAGQMGGLSKGVAVYQADQSAGNSGNPVAEKLKNISIYV